MPQPAAMPALRSTEAVAGSREAFLSDTTDVAKLSPAITPELTIPCVRFLCWTRLAPPRCATPAPVSHSVPVRASAGPSRRDSQLPGSSVDAQMLATLSLYKFAPSKRDELKPGDLKPAAQEFDALAPMPQGGRWSPYRAITVRVSGTWLNA
ncbi:hypothetical protein BBK36DRAFT_165449 [Trichoderma citrinoviride]|uniref:Uncharacterized protein n=1 Tax=Trichoderma citrinoviride TaxID=58853 RepID=A0A2T4B789_9HYPO|nr:hypothetical protein BBK36DRAFT_165449 [Trichoderma citrinoviride]PTB65170.1 hypothetical protein BBK36DRAFT_165449 [Trichoderma citrinoviride]